MNLSLFSQLQNWWSASSGVEAYFDKVNSNRRDESANGRTRTLKRGLYPKGGKHDSYSFYTLHHISLNKWTVDAGLRYNIYAIQIDDTSVGRVNINPAALAGNAGVSYHAVRNQHIYVTLNQGFRVSNFDDLGTLGIVDFRYELPEYNLKPERSANIEVGYKLGTKRVSAQIAGCYMKLYDFITRLRVEGQVINNYPVYQKANTGNAYIKGAEAEINWVVLNRLKLMVCHTTMVRT